MLENMTLFQFQTSLLDGDGDDGIGGGDGGG